MQMSSQPSLFKIAEETDTRLLLRPNPKAPLVFGAFFGGFGALFVGLALAFMDKHPAAVGMVPLGAVGLLLGLLSLKGAFLSKDQIVVDSDEKTARLTIGTGRSLTVQFESIEAILARRVQKTDKQGGRGRTSRRYTYHVYQVYFVTSAGDHLMIDESTAELAMMRRGKGLARRCGVPFVGSSMPEPAPAAPGIAALVLEDPTAAPRRVSCRNEGEASVYRWRRASFAPLNTLLFLATATLLGTLLFGCYLAVREGFAEGEVGLGLVLGAVGVVFAYLSFLLARYCLAGCELRISPTSVQYRVSMLGISLERRESPTSAVRSIPMNCAGLSRHRIDVRLQNRSSWPIELREVAIGDVFWLQQHWAEGLRLPRH